MIYYFKYQVVELDVPDIESYEDESDELAFNQFKENHPNYENYYYLMQVDADGSHPRKPPGHNTN